jgi:hypothetical protein
MPNFWTRDPRLWQAFSVFRFDHALVIGLICVCSSVRAFAAEPDDPDAYKPAIPPGQEKLLLEMLGDDAWLPEGCKLADGQVKYTVVQVTYRCPFGETVLEFAHVGEVASPDAQTDQFAITVKKGSAPVNLADVVADYIRSQEDDFEWTWPGLENSQDVEGDAGD